MEQQGEDFAPVPDNKLLHEKQQEVVQVIAREKVKDLVAQRQKALDPRQVRKMEKKLDELQTQHGKMMGQKNDMMPELLELRASQAARERRCARVPPLH